MLGVKGANALDQRPGHADMFGIDSEAGDERGALLGGVDAQGIRYGENAADPLAPVVGGEAFPDFRPRAHGRRVRQREPHLAGIERDPDPTRELHEVFEIAAILSYFDTRHELTASSNLE